MAGVQRLEEILLNTDGKSPLPFRFRALFALRNLNTDEAASIIGKAFADPSALLKHELAYCLGQMRLKSALPVLEQVLSDAQEDAMVRHEAAEAMGAIGQESSLAILKKYLSDPAKPVSETCEIAIDNILKNHLASRKCCQDIKAPCCGASSCEESEQETTSTGEGNIEFGSVDPAPALKRRLSTSVLQERLLDASLSLYDRYKAMFALRNRASQEAVLALCKGLKDSSALFRHEIGYVLGQLQHPVSIPFLAEALGDPQEVAMVRHECAEALGSIATPECQTILARFVEDPVDVVRESCLVALDMAEYEQSDELEMFVLPEH